MKSILLVRHAKSSWDSPTMQDFDRPLNDRGNRDAPMMANRLLERKAGIDIFVTSTAVRALTTAKYFIKAYAPKRIGWLKSVIFTMLTPVFFTM
jgi:phosphohistidine phosphatase